MDADQTRPPRVLSVEDAARTHETRTRSNRAGIGAIGEYYVHAELARRHWISGVMPPGAQRNDLVAQHEGGQLVAIQVKTGTTDVFRLTSKDEAEAKANEWFVLVRIPADSDKPPRYFIVPRGVISSMLRADHKKWIGGRKRNGLPRKDSPIRAIKMRDVIQYECRWDDLLAG